MVSLMLCIILFNGWMMVLFYQVHATQQYSVFSRILRWLLLRELNGFWRKEPTAKFVSRLLLQAVTTKCNAMQHRQRRTGGGKWICNRAHQHVDHSNAPTASLLTKWEGNASVFGTPPNETRSANIRTKLTCLACIQRTCVCPSLVRDLHVKGCI